MAIFNIHPGDKCIRKLINTRAFECESATEIASPVAVLEELKCAECSRLVLEDFNWWCQTGETIPHSICRPCIKVHKEEKALKTLPTCPIIIKVEQDEAVSCEKKLIGFENGVLRCMDHFLNMWRFPCGAEQYGCTFVGTKEQVRAHEVSQCIYKYLRVCSKPNLSGNTGELCGEVFNSHLKLSQHLETHGIKQQHLDESTYGLAFKDINDLTEEWVVIDRKLVDIPNGQFCTLMVCENNTEIRLWLQEIKSKEDNARGVKSQIYFARTPARGSEFPKFQHCCQTWVLPYDMTGLADDDFEAFEIKKEFLRRHADCQLDGNIHFSVKFQFFDIFSSAASPNSTDAEIETPSTQSVTKQKGVLDDAVQPDDVDKSFAAKLLLAVNDVDGSSCVAKFGDSQVPVVKQNKLDTGLIQPAVQKKQDAEPNLFVGGFEPVTWDYKLPMEEPSTGGPQSTERKLPSQRNPHPKDGWTSYAPQNPKDVRRHGGAERKDSGEISIAGEVALQETFPHANVGKPAAAAKEEKGDNASVGTNPHSPFRVPHSTEAGNLHVDKPLS